MDKKKNKKKNLKLYAYKLQIYTKILQNKLCQIGKKKRRKRVGAHCKWKENIRNPFEVATTLPQMCAHFRIIRKKKIIFKGSVEKFSQVSAKFLLEKFLFLPTKSTDYEIDQRSPPSNACLLIVNLFKRCWRLNIFLRKNCKKRDILKSRYWREWIFFVWKR